MIDAFGRAHYVRYDESSATRLTEMARRVVDEYRVICVKFLDAVART